MILDGLGRQGLYSISRREGSDASVSGLTLARIQGFDHRAPQAHVEKRNQKHSVGAREQDRPFEARRKVVTLTAQVHKQRSEGVSNPLKDICCFRKRRADDIRSLGVYLDYDSLGIRHGTTHFRRRNSSDPYTI